MKKRSLLLVLLIFILSISLVACSESEADVKEDEEVLVEGNEKEDSKDKVLKFACMAENENMVNWVVEELNSKGYDSEVIIYSSNQLPATALKDGDVDAVIQNQLKWLETFNKENKADLIMVEPYMYHGLVAMYSSKYDDINNLPNGAKIAIPGDPSNMDQILTGLAKIDLLRLGEKTGEFYSLIDIEENPKNIEFYETERGTTARAYQDVDAIICGATEAFNGGIDPTSYLYSDFDGDKYPHGLIINPKDKDEEWIEIVKDFYTTDEFKENLKEEFNNTFIPYP